MLDPALASRRVFALEREAELRWDRIDHVMRVSCALSDRAYLPEVQSYWVRAYRRDSRALLALGALDPFGGSPGRAEVEMFLGALPDEAVGALAIDVTGTPESRPPSYESRRSGVAADLGRAAVSAERLGLVREAAAAWRESAAAWAEAGDPDRSEMAENAPVDGRPPEVPYAAEVLISELTPGD